MVFLSVPLGAMRKVFDINTIGPALIAKHFLPKMRKNAKSVFAALSARVGSIGDNRLGGWYSYRASKAAANQIVHGAAIEIGRKRKEAVVVALHPGTVATGLSEPFAAERDRFTPAQSAGKMLAVLERLTPDDSGGFFAYDGSPIPW